MAYISKMTNLIGTKFNTSSTNIIAKVMANKKKSTDSCVVENHFSPRLLKNECIFVGYSINE
jgi:hypothetical protein